MLYTNRYNKSTLFYSRFCTSTYIFNYIFPKIWRSPICRLYLYFSKSFYLIVEFLKIVFYVFYLILSHTRDSPSRNFDRNYIIFRTDNFIGGRGAKLFGSNKMFTGKCSQQCAFDDPRTISNNVKWEVAGKNKILKMGSIYTTWRFEKRSDFTHEAYDDRFQVWSFELFYFSWQGKNCIIKIFSIPYESTK